MRHILKNIIIAAGLMQASVASAAIIENQALSFGTFGLRNNTAVYEYVIAPSGAITTDYEIVVINDGVPGDYTVTGFPASTVLTFQVLGSAPLTLGGTGGGVPFNIRNFNTVPNPITTDGAGTANFTMGAILETDGLGTMYADGAYSDDVLIEVSF